MLFSDLVFRQPSSPEDFGLKELQAQGLRSIGYCMVIAGVLLDICLAITDALPREAWLVTATLVVAGILSVKVTDRNALTSTGIIASGVGLSLIWAIRIFPDAPIICLLCVEVLFIGAVWGWQAGFSTAFVLTGLISMLASAFGQPTANAVVIVAVLLVWLSAFLSWLASKPLQTALTWSWQSYVRAQNIAEESRLRQGELGRLSKSLNETCEQLEQLSRELDRARRAAEDIYKAKASFAAAVSHELRTPLNLIIGFSDMIVKSPRFLHNQALSEYDKGDIEAIYRNAWHISELIDDILDLSQIDAQRMALVKQHVPLEKVIEQAVSTCRARFLAQGLRLTVEIPDNLPLLYIDPSRIRQVLINLLINALRFTEDGEITVSVHSREHEVIIAVADTGVGISSDDLPYVFQEFRQSGEPESRRGGSGLGLTVSKRFVEMHGGSMWATSTLGDGATFSFSLPLIDNLITSPYTSQRARLAVNGAETLAIVVLDESGEAARVIGRYLDGYRSIHVKNIAEALNLVTGRKARAIIVGSTDQQVDLFKLLLAAGDEYRVPVISCDLYSKLPTATKMGVADYLVKPVSRDKLASALRSFPEPPRRIIVADDDQEMAQLLVRMIHSCLIGSKVWVAQNGAEAVALAQHRRADLLLLDLLMPVLDGYAVLEQLQTNEKLRGIHVVAISGKGNEDETILASILTVGRPGGVSVGDTMHWIKASLDALLSPMTGNDGAQLGGWFD